MSRRAFLCLLLMLLLLSPLLIAEESEENYRVSLITTGPGEEVYLWWGHTALMVEELDTGRASFYDFGVFSFDTENFFLNFLFGRLWYMVYRSPASWSLDRMVERDRSLRQQVLSFPPGEKLKLVQSLREQVLPENRTYLYDYYFDNCATRIRDLLNDAYRGELRRVSADENRGTLRLQTRRYTAHNPAVEWALMFLMGPLIDQPITGWEAMYLPDEIPRYLSEIDSAIDEEILLHRSADETVIPERPAPGLLLPAAAGALLALLLILGRRAEGPLAITAQLIFRIILVFGAILGSVLFFLAFFTDHTVTHGNWNLLFLNPLHWLAVGIPFTISEKYCRPRYLLLFFPWILTIDASLILLILRLFDLPQQVLGQGIALLLPLAIGISGPWIGRVLMCARRQSIVDQG